MLPEDSAFRANLFMVDNANNLQRLLMQQAELLILFLLRSLCRYFMFGFFASLFYLIQSFFIAVNLLRLSTTILYLFSLLAFINCRDDVVCFIIFRKLLFFDNFRKIQRFILKRRIVFLVIDYFHKRYIFRKYFQFINCQLKCGSIIRT